MSEHVAGQGGRCWEGGEMSEWTRELDERA